MLFLTHSEQGPPPMSALSHLTRRSLHESHALRACTGLARARLRRLAVCAEGGGDAHELLALLLWVAVLVERDLVCRRALARLLLRRAPAAAIPLRRRRRRFLPRSRVRCVGGRRDGPVLAVVRHGLWVRLGEFCAPVWCAWLLGVSAVAAGGKGTVGCGWWWPSSLEAGLHARALVRRAAALTVAVTALQRVALLLPRRCCPPPLSSASSQFHAPRRSLPRISYPHFFSSLPGTASSSGRRLAEVGRATLACCCPLARRVRLRPLITAGNRTSGGQGGRPEAHCPSDERAGASFSRALAMRDQQKRNLLPVGRQPALPRRASKVASSSLRSSVRFFPSDREFRRDAGQAKDQRPKRRQRQRLDASWKPRGRTMRGVTSGILQSIPTTVPQHSIRRFKWAQESTLIAAESADQIVSEPQARSVVRCSRSRRRHARCLRRKASDRSGDRRLVAGKGEALGVKCASMPSVASEYGSRDEDDSSALLAHSPSPPPRARRSSSLNGSKIGRVRRRRRDGRTLQRFRHLPPSTVVALRESRGTQAREDESESEFRPCDRGSETMPSVPAPIRLFGTHLNSILYALRSSPRMAHREEGTKRYPETSSEVAVAACRGDALFEGILPSEDCLCPVSGAARPLRRRTWRRAVVVERQVRATTESGSSTRRFPSVQKRSASQGIPPVQRRASESSEDELQLMKLRRG